MISIGKKALRYLNSLPDKDRRLIKEHLYQLEDPRTASDVELLENGHCRMHVSRSYTVFFDVHPGNVVYILEIMTIEQAHKRYNRM
jgi:mRNA-degrading endonuclease RelE of RelBE toxin-antitoxin system